MGTVSREKVIQIRPEGRRNSAFFKPCPDVEKLEGVAVEVIFEDFGRVAAGHDSGVVDGGLMGEEVVEAVGRLDHGHEPVGAVEDLGGEIVGAFLPALGDEGGDLIGECLAFHRIRDFSLGAEFAIDVLVFPAEVEDGAAPAGQGICAVPIAAPAGVTKAEAELGEFFEDRPPSAGVGKLSVTFAGLDFILSAMGEDGYLLVRAPLV